jgi:mono/diheme cytochrome c family protein
MRSGPSPGFCLVLLLFLLGLPARSPAGPSAAEVEFFEKEVRPLLVEKCAKCHGDSKPKGGLKLTSRAHVLAGGDSVPAVVAGKPDESLLVRAVRYEDRPRMPPKGKLTDRQIAALVRWVERQSPGTSGRHPSPHSRPLIP